MQEIIYTSTPDTTLADIITGLQPDKVFFLADRHTAHHCLPRLVAEPMECHAFPAGEESKNPETLFDVLRWLSSLGCTRHSLLVNVGGGVVTDLGGFAAGIFKRGIRFVNVPTSLLAMVDASVGGKTGIDFNGCKNEVGVFACATHVIIAPTFLQTLDMENFLSGYAEMLKHSLLIGREAWQRHIAFLGDFLSGRHAMHDSDVDGEMLMPLIRESIAFKQRIVDEDPTESGIRKCLNLGHTLGHAIESLLLAKGHPVLHGYAVAWGLVACLYISAATEGLPTEILHSTAQCILEAYRRPDIVCDDYDAIHRLLLHDKKNISGQVRFTLLGAPGKVLLDRQPSVEIINEALDFLREA